MTLPGLPEDLRKSPEVLQRSPEEPGGARRSPEGYAVSKGKWGYSEETPKSRVGPLLYLC